MPVDDQLPSRQAVAVLGMALVDEVCELVKLLEWRTWRLRTPVSEEKVAMEFADILAFLGVLTLYVQMFAKLDPLDLAEAYSRKTAINVERIAGLVEGFGTQESKAE